MKRGLYQIIDHKAEDVVSGILHILPNENMAIRFFTDCVTAENSQIRRHPEDYAMVRMGWLNEDLTITPHTETIMEGKTLVAILNTGERPE